MSRRRAICRMWSERSREPRSPSVVRRPCRNPIRQRLSRRPRCLWRPRCAESSPSRVPTARGWAGRRADARLDRRRPRRPARLKGCSTLCSPTATPGSSTSSRSGSSGCSRSRPSSTPSALLHGVDGERVVTDLRRQVYDHLHRLDLRYFSTTRTGEITSRLTNDVSRVQTTATDDLAMALQLSLTLVGSLRSWWCSTGASRSSSS